MNAYIFQAALYCGPCIRQMMLDRAMVESSFDHSNHDPADALASMERAQGFTSESDYDSGDYPKGPYGDGGGESDTPSHCDACHAHLENPLTGDGADYVRQALARFTEPGDTAEEIAAKAEATGRHATAAGWARFYSWALDERADA